MIRDLTMRRLLCAIAQFGIPQYWWARFLADVDCLSVLNSQKFGRKLMTKFKFNQENSVRLASFLSVAVLVFGSFSMSASAVVIMIEDFEDATLDYVGPTDALADKANRDFYGRTGNFGSYTLNNVQGSTYYAAEDIDGASVPIPSGSPLDLVFTVNITGYTDLSFNILMAEDDSTDGAEDWDAHDHFLVFYQIDGGGVTNLFAVEAPEPGGDLTNNEAREDTDFDGIGDGIEITDTFNQFSKTIAGTGNSLVLTVRFLSDDNPSSGSYAGDEDIAFDNVTINGTPVPEPTTFALFALGLGTIVFPRRRRK
jgi:hypothetical protein